MEINHYVAFLLLFALAMIVTKPFEWYAELLLAKTKFQKIAARFFIFAYIVLSIALSILFARELNK